MIAPLIIYNDDESTPSIVRATKMIRNTNTPTIIPAIEPVPPTNETPPITQAAIASHSAFNPVLAATEPLRTP